MQNMTVCSVQRPSLTLLGRIVENRIVERSLDKDDGIRHLWGRGIGCRNNLKKLCLGFQPWASRFCGDFCGGLQIRLHC